VAVNAPGNVAEPGWRRRGGVPPRLAEVASVFHIPLLPPRSHPRRFHSGRVRARGHQRHVVVAGVRHGHGEAATVTMEERSCGVPQRCGCSSEFYQRITHDDTKNFGLFLSAI
jgi:hypothetical protein